MYFVQLIIYNSKYMYLNVEKKSYRTTITTNHIKTKQEKTKINKQRTTTNKQTKIKENEG